MTHTTNELLVAAATGNTEGISRLVQSGAAPDASLHGHTPLQCAIITGQTGSVRALLDAGADPDKDNPLGLCVGRNLPDIVQLLLGHGADPHRLKKTDTWGEEVFSPIEEACRQQDWGFLHAYIDTNPDGANALDQRSNVTLLHFAAMNLQDELCAFLLHKGADPQLPDKLSENALGFLPPDSGPYRKLRKYIQNGTLPKFPESAKKEPAKPLPPLFAVIQEGDTFLLELMLEHGESPALRLADGTTPLHLAAKLQRADCIRILLKHGAEVDSINARGESPLYIATREDSAICVAALLEAGANPDLGPGETPLMACAAHPIPETAEYLLHARADVSATNADGLTALDLARRNDNEYLADMLELYIDTDHFTSFSVDQIHLAAEYATLDELETLLLLDACPNALDGAGNTPLFYARQAKFDSLERQRLLIACGADYRHRNKWGVSFLYEFFYAAQDDPSQVSRLEALLKDTDVNELDASGCNILHYAVYDGCHHVVRFLLEHGADPAIPTAQGGLPLEIAMGRSLDDNTNHDEIIELLRPVSPPPRDPLPRRLGHELAFAALTADKEKMRGLILTGAPIEGDDWGVVSTYGHGSIPLLELCDNCMEGVSQEEQAEMVRMLLDAGADINHSLCNKDTALHIAARNNKHGIARVLLEAGADPTRYNNSGCTPLETALDHDSYTSADILRDWMETHGIPIEIY